MSNKRSIFNALPIVAAHYGQRFGVEVCVGDDNPGTDGTTIFVPNVPEDSPHKNAVWGLLVHEAGHIRETCFSTWNSFDSKAEPLRQILLNAFEDVRIERSMVAKYPGVSRDIEAAISFGKERDWFAFCTEESPPGAVLQAAVLYWGRTYLLGQSLVDYSKAADEVVEKLFPAGVAVRLDTLRRKVASTTSTAECLELTDAVLRMLREEEDKEKSNVESQRANQPDSSQDPSEQEDDAVGSNASAGDEGSSSSEAAADQGSSSDSTQTSSTDLGSAGQHPGAGSPSQSDASTLADMERKLAAIQRALNSGSNELLPDVFEQIKQDLVTEAQQGDSSYCSVPYAPTVVGNANAGQQLLERVQSTTSKLRAQLLGLVQSHRLSKDRAAAAGRRIDGKRITRILSGDTRIFKQRVDRQEPNTAVHILADLSGSMQGQPEAIAREASLAIALALEGIPRVSPAVTYFSGYSDDPVRSAVRHGESVKKNAHRFVEFSRGTTPLAEGLWYAAFELSKLKEHRRMIVVITDGDPNNRGACDTVLKLCSNAGIELIGIGIRHHRIKQLFDHSIVIDDVSELRSTLFQLMKDQLIFDAA